MPETPSPRWSLRSLSDQDSIRIHPVVLAAARCTPPISIYPSIGNKWQCGAHVRQCERSLSFHWHDDPPQQVRALLHNLLYNAPALVVILLHFVVALQRHRRRPRIGLVALQQLRPVVRFPCCHRSSDQCACQVQDCHCTATHLSIFCPVFLPSPRPPESTSQTSCWLLRTLTSCVRIRAHPSQPTVCSGSSYHPQSWFFSLFSS